MAATETKRCGLCGQVQSVAKFYRRKDKSGGYRSICKKCWVKKGGENYRRQDPEILRQKRQSHVASMSLEKRAKWRRQQAEWYRRNKRHHQKLMRIHCAKRAATRKSLPADFSREDMQRALQFFDHRCAACGVAVGGFVPLHWDHWIPLNHKNCPGTIVDNMVPLCELCNISKHDTDAKQWLVKCFGPTKAKAILKSVQRYFQRTGASNRCQ